MPACGKEKRNLDLDPAVVTVGCCRLSLTGLGTSAKDVVSRMCLDIASNKTLFPATGRTLHRSSHGFCGGFRLVNPCATIRFCIPHSTFVIPHFRQCPVFIHQLAAKRAKLASEDIKSVTDYIKSVTDFMSLVTEYISSATKTHIPSLTSCLGSSSGCI